VNTRQLLIDRFRCPGYIADFALTGDLSSEPGYFQLGEDLVCYGQCSSGVPAKSAMALLHDALEGIGTNRPSVQIPFDPVQVIDNLRNEQYLGILNDTLLTRNKAFLKLYYSMRPAVPLRMRKHLQALYFRNRDTLSFPAWPVDATVEKILDQLLVLAMKSRHIRKIPFIWFWPQRNRSCTILTHDVETRAGMQLCPRLMDLADSFAVKTSFQIVPEKRYHVSEAFLNSIRQRGFEINIHDLNHDGLLFADREQFLRRADRINHYARQFGARGFRSGMLYRNAGWLDALDVSYDMSIPNVAHMDPQPGGCCTIFPFFVNGILELPVTTTQDYTLFHILNDYSIGLWQEQIALIRERHGLISFIIHPDYVIDEKAQSVYIDLLHYLTKLRSHGETWIALPREVDSWWRLRSNMDLINVRGSWQIRGEGSERARLAYAVLNDDETLRYELADPSQSNEEDLPQGALELSLASHRV
jgi:hypothetical protein